MTNYGPIKNKIWDAAKNDNKDEFNKFCSDLMEKVAGEWWRLGWNLAPKNVDEIIEIFKNLAKSAHDAWIEAMKIGDAPPEDVSPGEGFQRCAEIIEKLENGKKKDE